MADIKTRDMVKGTIKTIDKAAVAADRIESGIDRASHEAAHQFDKQGRKGVEATKQNISKAKDGKGFCKGSSKSGTGGKSCRYCCRRLGCCCGNYRNLADWAFTRFCVRDILFGRGFGYGYEYADGGAGNQCRI